MSLNTANVVDCLRVHGDLDADEIEGIEHHWTSLDKRLNGLDRDSVILDLYVKDRDTPSQHLTLEARVAGWPPLVATTSEPELGHALNVVRDEMVRLVGKAKDTHRPRHNRGRR